MYNSRPYVSMCVVVLAWQLNVTNIQITCELSTSRWLSCPQYLKQTTCTSYFIYSGQLGLTILAGHLSPKTKTYQQRSMCFLLEIQYTFILYYNTGAPFGGPILLQSMRDSVDGTVSFQENIYKDVHKPNIRNITLSHVWTFLWSNPNS